MCEMKNKVFLQRIADSEWIAFQFCLEGSCAFLLEFLGFISDLNIHVFWLTAFERSL